MNYYRNSRGSKISSHEEIWEGVRKGRNPTKFSFELISGGWASTSRGG